MLRLGLLLGCECRPLCCPACRVPLEECFLAGLGQLHLINHDVFFRSPEGQARIVAEHGVEGCLFCCLIDRRVDGELQHGQVLFPLHGGSFGVSEDAPVVVRECFVLFLLRKVADWVVGRRGAVLNAQDGPERVFQLVLELQAVIRDYDSWHAVDCDPFLDDCFGDSGGFLVGDGCQTHYLGEGVGDAQDVLVVAVLAGDGAE